MASADVIQNSAQAQANSYISQMQVFLSHLENYLLTTVTVPLVNTVLDTSQVDNALTNLLATSQTNPPIPLQIATMPAVSLPSPLPIEAGLNVPEFINISAPNIQDIVAPSVGNDVFSGESPTINYPVAAARPTVVLPDAPSFNNVALPTITDVAIPQFTAVAPTDDLTAPSNLFAFSENEYSSALLDASKAKLLNDMANGGYGIEVADETLLWQRARDRELRNADTASTEISRQIAARGFSLPPGAMLSQLASTQQEGLEKVSSVSRDISLKRADMYVENRKFTITETRELETLLINLHMNVMERALNAAKATAEFGISLYNARVNKFNVLMQGFRATVEAYQAQVQGALGQLEAQKVKLQVAMTEVDVQKAQAELYNIQVDGQKALIDMYRADISAVQGLADVERLKLDSFKAEIEAFSEKIRAGTLQLQGYEAQVRGNLTKAEIYRDQISAQATQAEIAKSQASVIESNARVKVENMRANIAAAVATADIYRAQTQGTAASNEAQERAFAARTEAFRSIAIAYEAMGRLDVAKYDSTTRTALENIRNEISAAKIVMDMRLGSATVGANTLSRAVEASLNQVIGLEAAISNSA
jgi:hypothetical protein